MTKPMQLPNDEVMREMAKVAIEKATEDIAVSALEMANEMRRGGLPMPNGADALESWARAIRNNNEWLYGLKNRDPHS